MFEVEIMTHRLDAPFYSIRIGEFSPGLELGLPRMHGGSNQWAMALKYQQQTSSIPRFKNSGLGISR
jgi:hypothetical protein